MIQSLKKQQLEARKNKNKFTSGIFTSLISEITAIGKNNGNRATTDEEALKVVAKFRKNTLENLKLIKDSNKVEELNKELAIYEEILPSKLSLEETTSAVKAVIGKNPEAHMGIIMGALKKKHGDSLDMSITSNLVKEFLK
ncbi:GatB/YqeY domain-containing protein [bacterium]|jgi:uncharacterized protein YqeY|nr:GatB/YqeY domain-containing protein [bacterium]